MNITLLTDLYQLTMANGYFLSGKHKKIATFDLFFRVNSINNYAVFAGLEQAIDYIQNLKITNDDIKYLKNLKIFDESFLNYLKGFKFTGNIFSVAEGEVVFPSEPLLVVQAPLIEAQIIETALLNIIGHQTLIATKAARIVHSAGEKPVYEYGVRRAHGTSAGIYGARAAVIGGCKGTSNVLSAKEFDLPVIGTHAHSWVASFDSEIEAFRKMAEIYPNRCMLLVDTYDTLSSGVPNAIKVFEELRQRGHRPLGIRLDSGDLAYLSKEARRMLDEAGFQDAIIFASNDLDEEVISQLNLQSACIDSYGVGTKLITSYDSPALGAVYKLSQIEDEPKMKFSETLAKMTNPGFKKVMRLYDKDSGKALADLIMLNGEELPSPLTLQHETEKWKNVTIENFTKRELLVPIFERGKLVYKTPKVKDSAEKLQSELEKFWDEYKRLSKPHIYKVNVSEGLSELKQRMIEERN
ncbi:MAG: nicotinate phosphoribosyltransferase [Firmicutes bacterium]|nr:nicotinate phosphoribosyltransferase [Bacillota bacterium]MCL2255669.1 nicotinate phosphoribosyltransferase [Bacillota bacterium]